MSHAELRNLTVLCVRLLSHPLNVTTASTQQHAKHVIAMPTFRNIITSSWPWRIAAIVNSSVENINSRPPHARKNDASASVGGLDGRIERGGPSQRKKYVMHLSIANAERRYPQIMWICTWNMYVWA